MTGPEDVLPWYRKVRWLHATMLIIIPSLGLLSIPWVPCRRETMILALVYFANTALAVTAGYHRLWAHRSYTASTPIRIYLALFGAAAVEGPIKWWAREHRAHHRYTDTDEDPYSIKKGFLHAHLLWMVVVQPPRTRHVDISDLKKDKVVMWQSRNFILLAIVMAWVLPTIIAGFFWNDSLGGFLYGGILRMFAVHQFTFSVNSAAHYFGDQPYDDRLSARNNTLVALLTFGEGYHNFHHKFPSDYRNGIRWHDLDPAKWAIHVWNWLGLVGDLKRFRSSDIAKHRVREVPTESY